MEPRDGTVLAATAEHRTTLDDIVGFGLKQFSGHSMVHSEEELKMLVTASQEAGVIEEQEEQMLHRVRARRFPSAASWSIRVLRTVTSANSEATKNALASTIARTAMRRSVAADTDSITPSGSDRMEW